MVDAFLQPMFDSRVDVLGLPLSTVIVAVAFVVLVAGFAWMRRITGVEREPRTFRATTRPDPFDRSMRAVALAAVVFAAVFALATFLAG
jgi:hypothetical protein